MLHIKTRRRKSNALLLIDGEVAPVTLLATRLGIDDGSGEDDAVRLGRLVPNDTGGLGRGLGGGGGSGSGGRYSRNRSSGGGLGSGSEVPAIGRRKWSVSEKREEKKEEAESVHNTAALGRGRRLGSSSGRRPNRGGGGGRSGGGSRRNLRDELARISKVDLDLRKTGEGGGAAELGDENLDRGGGDGGRKVEVGRVSVVNELAERNRRTVGEGDGTGEDVVRRSNEVL
jgi:hypothetical protein